MNILSGTITLGSAERLLDTSYVSIGTDANLVLGGNEKIGTLLGTGVLTVQAGTSLWMKAISPASSPARLKAAV